MPDYEIEIKSTQVLTYQYTIACNNMMDALLVARDRVDSVNSNNTACVPKRSAFFHEVKVTNADEG